MKKDIDFPVSKEVYMAIVSEFNETYQTQDWYAYISNASSVDLEMVLIVSGGINTKTNKATSNIRHKIEHLPSGSFAKVELMQEELLEQVDNLFNVTYFSGGKMFDKQFEFKQGTVVKDKIKSLENFGGLKGVQVD
jgi:hypothetical protein